MKKYIIFIVVNKLKGIGNQLTKYLKKRKLKNKRYSVRLALFTN